MIPLPRLACLLLIASGIAQAAPDDIQGRWLSGDGEGWIRIEVDDNRLTGAIAGSPATNPAAPPRLDDLNPDPELRTRPLDGLVIMSGFRYDGNGKWSGGTIYDPNSGKTYKCTLRLLDRNTLKVRGYVGVSLFGRNDTWTRDEE